MRQEMREERRVVTAMFADLVDSAALAVRGWSEFGKSSANVADLRVDPSSPRA